MQKIKSLWPFQLYFIPDMQKIKSVAVNRTGKVEVHITDNQSWNSCGRVASDHVFTFGSAIEPTRKKQDAL